MKAGMRLASSVCETEVMVIRAADVALDCGGQPMLAPGGERPGGEPAADLAGGTELGKRYSHDESGLQVLCVRPGAGTLSIAGVPLEQMVSKQLPSSD
ncbi:hypothetical protein GB882_07305 [Georgenia ruanii]|uniref:Uncharacterized protein n=2 Tax=Georgenia ruanii TaxID=348442 RepID=A0A7J9UX75_9MICO|nr:hypothetical protein [Georgenia ruanii]